MVKKVTIYEALMPFLSDPLESFHLLDISRTIKQPHPTTRQWLNIFEKKGVLTKSYKGRLTLYKLNLKHQNLIDHLSIAEKTKLISLCNKNPILSDLVSALRENVSLNANLIIFGSASHDFKNAEVNYWSYRGNKGFAEIKIKLPYRIYIDIFGDYYDKDYRDIYPGTGIERHDKIWSGTFSGTKFLSDRFSLSLGLYYTDNSSNIDLFDYERIIPSLFVNVRF